MVFWLSGSHCIHVPRDSESLLFWPLFQKWIVCGFILIIRLWLDTQHMPDPNPIDDVEIFGAKGDACLQVGDTIALCLQREGKFFCVGSEGFVDLGTSLREVAFESTIPWTFIDCQWVVTNKFQYDAQEKLRRHLKAQQRAKAEVAGAEGVPQHKEAALSTAALSTVKGALLGQKQKKRPSWDWSIEQMMREKREGAFQDKQRDTLRDLLGIGGARRRDPLKCVAKSRGAWHARDIR